MKIFFERLEKVIRYTFGIGCTCDSLLMNKLPRMYANEKRGRH